MHKKRKFKIGQIGLISAGLFGLLFLVSWAIGAQSKTTAIAANAGGLSFSAIQAADVKGQLLQCGRPDPENPAANTGTSRPCELCDLFILIKAVVNVLLSIVGSLAVLNIIIAGIMYILGPSIQSETFSIERAKKTLTFTVTGFVLVGLSWLIISTAANLAGYTKEGTIFEVNCDKINELSK